MVRSGAGSGGKGDNYPLPHQEKKKKVSNYIFSHDVFKGVVYDNVKFLLHKQCDVHTHGCNLYTQSVNSTRRV
jgi:hypothetical protein